MGFRWITTYQFRNLVDAKVPLDAADICFIGENGQGKTNFLETVYLLCFGASFRTQTERELIRHGKDSFSLSGGFIPVDTDEYPILAEQKVHVKLTKGKKDIQVNDRRIHDRKEIISNMPCIVFAHDDFFFVNGTPERKRWFFNQTLSLYDPLFIDSLRRYRKIVKARNIVLKEKRMDEIEVLTYQLAETGVVLCQKRVDLIRRFNTSFSPLFKKISGLFDLEIHYRPSWKRFDSVKPVLSILDRIRARDIEFGTSTTGPHRDTFTILQGDQDFTRTASTGQIRLISLVLRVAQAVFFKTMTGKQPILLLDDVLLELDRGKRKAFFESLPEYDQAFFTFLSHTDIEYIGKQKPLVYAVNKGSVTGWKKPEMF